MMSRISNTFIDLRKKGRKAFIPYIMTGHPDIDRTHRLIRILEDAGADIIELGVPFSDPLADGPTIQAAAQTALSHGVTLHRTIDFVREIRGFTQIPIILMTYYNPVFKYGEERFAKDASEAGVDGIIIPDLPPDEAGSLIGYCRGCGIDTIFLIAPTSTPERIERVVKSSTGFIYYVSMTGITGSNLAMDLSIESHINSIRKKSKTPLAVGFGISSPDEAASVSRFSDGVIVGSAIVKKAGCDDDEMLGYLRSLRDAIK